MMEYTPIGLGDFSNNRFAAMMKELAAGLVNWAKLLLIPFSIYQIYIHTDASLFSLKALFTILGIEFAFIVAVILGNMIESLLVMPLAFPFMYKNKVVIAQNIQQGMLVVYGFVVCVASWYFAEFAVNYVYS